MRRSPAAGFTLAELMLVMVLLGVVIGLGVATVDRADPGARGLQKSVEAFVQSARDRARSVSPSDMDTRATKALCFRSAVSGGGVKMTSCSDVRSGSCRSRSISIFFGAWMSFARRLTSSQSSSLTYR